MVLGRLVMGIGFGADDLVQCKITTDWFKNNFLAFALAMNLTFGRLGTAANFTITPMLLDKFGFDEAQACWFGLCIAVTSGLAVLVATYLDRPESRAAAGVPIYNSSPADNDEDYDEGKMTCTDFSRLGSLFFALLLSVMMIYGACQPFLHIASDVSFVVFSMLHWPLLFLTVCLFSFCSIAVTNQILSKRSNSSWRFTIRS
jgi:hypothetical protein